MPAPDVLHGVHERFAGADPALPNGFAEHTPMGVDAMVALGLDASRVAAWAEHHRPQPLGPGEPIVAVRDALRAELQTDDWEAVLRRHARVLLPAADAHLFHGLIRTAHAVRALGRRDDEAARAELATGMAAWSVWADRPLATGTPATTSADTGRGLDAGGADPAAATPSASATAPPPGPLDAEAVVLDAEAVVLDAARRGAGAFVARPSIFTLHAVTAPMALLQLWPVLDGDGHRAGADVIARTHAAHPPVAPETIGALDTRSLREDEVARVADHWDAHPAKLVEACRRGYDHVADPVFLAAARQVAGG